MKGEYVLEEKKDHSSNSSKSSMFGKLHHHHHQSPQNFQQSPSHHHHHHHNHHHQQQQQHQQQQPNFHHPAFQLSRECQTSEEDDSTTHRMSPTDRNDPLNPQPVSAVAPPHPPPSSAANDGATIEVVRRPRGRPPGSKNKPKPPVIITRDAEPSMSPYILEIPIGVDIIYSITKFCRKRNMGLCVLNGSGTVTNVTLRQPSTTPVSTVTFHGRFDILSISATIVQPNASVPSSNNGIANGFTISLAGPQGQVVGGGVVGPLVTAGTVYLIAATFNGPSFHRLPVEEELARSSGGGNEGGVGHQSPPHQEVSGGDSGHPPATTAPESCGMSMYSCHLPSDVIWAPTARQPPPPPPPPY